MYSLRQSVFSFGILCVAVSGLFLQSCEKKEDPVVLPPSSGSFYKRIDLGAKYRKQVYFNVEDTVIAGESMITDWDLHFEADPDGYRVYLNGGNQVFIYNTYEKDFGAITVLPAGIPESAWKFDFIAQGKAGTAVGDWQPGGVSGGDVFIVRSGENSDYYKIRFISVDATGYVIETGLLSDTSPKTVTLPKDKQFNFVYYSFKKGVLQAEPPKDKWDVVFTHYRTVYPEFDNLPYPVTGALLNPAGVQAAMDSTVSYAEMNAQRADQMSFSSVRDVIGYDWKSYSIANDLYTVKPYKIYVLKTRNGQLWKLHFVSFLSASGENGSPTFEYERMR